MKPATEIINLIEYVKISGGILDEAGYLRFPENLGSGYLKIIKPSQEITIMLQQYELKNSLVIKRSKHSDTNDTLIFSFRNILTMHRHKQNKISANLFPSVQVSTSDIALKIQVPAFFETSNIVVGIKTDFLRQLLKKDNPSFIELVTKNQQSYFYEEIISAKIQSVALELFQQSATHRLVNFFYQLKAEELIYLFLELLSQREDLSRYPINQNDVETICALREDLLKNIGTVPRLDILAEKANMSVSKVGKLFKQIFGDSIYNYYQKIRMQQAVILLQEEKLSVTDVGYQLGFSNLSHFTRLFEKHIGMKPKRYSKSL